MSHDMSEAGDSRGWTTPSYSRRVHNALLPLPLNHLHTSAARLSQLYTAPLFIIRVARTPVARYSTTVPAHRALSRRSAVSQPTAPP